MMIRFLLGALAALASITASNAQAPASTLDRIASTGTLRIGYSPDSAPFSYLDAEGKVVGYSIELCGHVANRLQAQLGLATLDITYVRRTTSDRVALLQNGDIDIECVASTNNAERRKSVAFSYPHFLTAVQFISLKEGGPRVVADLKGRTVATTSGTTVIGELNALNRAQKLNIAVVPTPNHQTGFEMMATGHVAAFVMDGILLSTMAANTNDPSLFALSSDTFGPPEPYGLMLRHDDAPFTEAVNAALFEIFTGGEIGGIYDRWFTQPIPPRSANLNLPLSAELRAAFATPTVVGD